MQLLNIIDEFPETLQTPVLHLVTALREERGVSHEDFSELKGVVQELAEAQRELAAAQNRTEKRVEELAESQKELAAAQQRTEKRVEELAESQKELAAAQNRTEKRVEELAAAQNRTEKRVEELAEAQKRTESRMAELAEAQHCMIQSMDLGFKRMDDKISALGSRWGLQNETTVRNLLQGVLGKTEYSVQRGYYGNREVDIIIRGDNTHILLEVTSAIKASDIPKYIASADDYEAQTGVTPLIMVAAPHVPMTALKAILNASRPIELYSDDEEEEI
jgi:hypothetical protein